MLSSLARRNPLGSWNEDRSRVVPFGAGLLDPRETFQYLSIVSSKKQFSRSVRERTAAESSESVKVG